MALILLTKMASIVRRCTRRASISRQGALHIVMGREKSRPLTTIHLLGQAAAREID